MDLAIVEPSCQAQAAERRAMCRALIYWFKLHRDDDLPAAADVDMNAEPDLAPHLFLLKIVAGEPECHVVDCGGVLEALCGADPRGRCARETLPPDFREAIPYQCENVVSFAKPLSDSGVSLAHGGEIAYRTVFMPLSEDKRTVDHILGSLSFKKV